MIRVTLHDAGRLGARLTVLDEDEADMNGAWVEGHHNGAEWHVQDGAVVQRPALDLPSAHSLVAGDDWSLPGVPDGTAVLVDGADVGAADAAGLVLRFDEPGEYGLALRPPFPWRPAECAVTVT